jgi:uncharacterized protein YjdB
MPFPRLGVTAFVVIAAVFGCTEGTGPGSLGQLRLRPVFSPGEEPTTLGVSLSEIRIVLRRSDGAVVADTSVPYVVGETTSWLIDLDDPPDSVGINADLGQGAAIMYAGAGHVALPAGIGSSSTEHDLLVRYLIGPAFSVDVSPDSARLHSSGETQQFTAVARDPGGAPLSGFFFAWSSSRPDVATVNAAGVVTAVAPGRAEITAAVGGVTGTATAIVGHAPARIVVSPDSSVISLGGTQHFRAVVLSAAGDTITGMVTSWSSTSVDVATVSDSGLVTAVAVGRTLIIARLGALADSAPVVVIDGNAATIIVTPPQATVTAVGATQQFTAVALNAQGAVIPGVTFQWSSSLTGVAMVNGTGLATATGAGTSVITASANGVTGSATLVVSLGAVRVVVVPPVVTLHALGATRQFVALAFDASGRQVPGVQFTWASSNPAVASIDGSGVATAQGPGNVTIVASAGPLRGDASLVVRQTVHSIVVNPPSAQLARGDNTTFTATAFDENGHVIPGTVFGWSTTNPVVATVDGTGTVTGVGGGSTLVRATAGGLTGASTLSVVVVGSVEILGEAEQHVTVGSTRQFVAVVRDTAGAVLSGVAVSWSVLDPSLASITNTGLVTGLATGGTWVRATAGGVFGEVELIVRPTQ